MGELPPKLFFRIGEVAGLVGVEPHVLRYWEREFRSIRPTKSAKGQRVYSRKDVENLLRVRDLLYRDGFTIAGAKKKLLVRPGEEHGQEQEAAALSQSSSTVALSREDASSDRRPAPFGVVGEEPQAPSGVARGPAPSGADVQGTLPEREGAHEPAPVSAAQTRLAPPVSTDEPAFRPPLASDVREKLVALRDEVEAFLEELSSPRR